MVKAKSSGVPSFVRTLSRVIPDQSTVILVSESLWRQFKELTGQSQPSMVSQYQATSLYDLHSPREQADKTQGKIVYVGYGRKADFDLLAEKGMFSGLSD